MIPRFDPANPRPLARDTSWFDYGCASFETEDTDPVYCAMARSGLSDDQLKRFVVGLCCYYHKGSAGYLSQFSGRRFWDEVVRQYDISPRRSMRRHFRGDLGRTAIAIWRERWPQPELWIDELLEQPAEWLAIRRWAKGVHQVGNYFTWKLADMYHVLSAQTVDMEGSVAYMVDKTKKGLQSINPLATLEANMDVMLKAFRSTKITAPPHHRRLIDIAEVETICCQLPDVARGALYLGGNPAEYWVDFNSYPCEANEALVAGMFQLSPFTKDYVRAVARKKGLIK